MVDLAQFLYRSPYDADCAVSIGNLSWSNLHVKLPALAPKGHASPIRPTDCAVWNWRRLAIHYITPRDNIQSRAVPSLSLSIAR